MGLFNRNKSTKASKDLADGDASTNGSKSTPSSKNGAASFSSLTLPDIKLPPPPDPNIDPVGYLRSLHSVRISGRRIVNRAKRNQLTHFTVDPSKLPETAGFVVSLIKRDFGPGPYQSIPNHSRWAHFEAGGRPRLDNLLLEWGNSVDTQEKTRRLLDLFVVSVLLDQGAGTRWSYKSIASGRSYKRSEGLAIATLEMFQAGYFSGDRTNPHQVDASGLRRLNVATLAKGLQVTEVNSIAGLEGRASLLPRLSDALRNPKYFGPAGRPGGMLDYLLSHPTTQASSVPIITIPTLWDVLQKGLSGVWPATTTIIDGVPLGDAFVSSSMPQSSQPWESVVTFHKLPQWLCYSLMTPMTKIMNVRFAGTELLTGLPEYRNGGLFLDTGVLTLKEADQQRGLTAYRESAALKGQPNFEVVPLFPMNDDVILEWRACTVGLLDELLVEVNSQLGLSGPDKLSLSQMLEAGTWPAGRELAEVSRPNTREPPIMIFSDGTGACFISGCDDDGRKAWLLAKELPGRSS